MSWVIFTLTFFLASAEVLFDFYFERAFGMYSIFLVTFTLIWLGRFYAYFRFLKKSVEELRGHTETIDLKDVPRSKRAIVEEVQRGNTETLVDKRDDLSSL
jgi:membrane-anchored glycerophosphoryl diester phosphodiesterase (GDPDase)